MDTQIPATKVFADYLRRLADRLEKGPAPAGIFVQEYDAKSSVVRSNFTFDGFDRLRAMGGCQLVQQELAGIIFDVPAKLD